VGVGKAVFMAERTLVRFLTTWEAEVKFETSEPCPPPPGRPESTPSSEGSSSEVPPGTLWDRVGDEDIRLTFFNRSDIFRLQTFRPCGRVRC